MNSVQKIVLGVGLLFVAWVMHRACLGTYLFTPMDENLVGLFKPWHGFSLEYAVIVGVLLPMLAALAGTIILIGAEKRSRTQ